MQVVGKRRVDADVEPGHRMAEGEPSGVQDRTVGRPARSLTTVRGVAYYRMSDRRQMNANLVGATRFEFAGQERGVGLGELAFHAIVRTSLLAGGNDRHAERITWITPDRRVDRSGRSVEVPPSQRHITPLDVVS